MRGWVQLARLITILSQMRLLTFLNPCLLVKLFSFDKMYNYDRNGCRPNIIILFTSKGCYGCLGVYSNQKRIRVGNIMMSVVGAALCRSIPFSIPILYHHVEL